MTNALAGKMDKSANGADIADVAEFLNNLGLGAGSALPVGVPVPWLLAVAPVGWLKCNGATREYLSQSTEFLPVGVGVPANACTEKPLTAKSGYVVCRNSKLTGWEYLADHRGKTVWNVKTGAAQVITVPGGYPANTTLYQPATPYDKWNGERWVTDVSAQQTAAVLAANTTKLL